MRQIAIYICLSLSVAAEAQQTRWEVSLHLQPEITFHKDSYPWWQKGNDKRTLNAGVVSQVQYNINDRFFLNGGVGFVSRNLETGVYINNKTLPPPRRRSTDELVTTEKVTYRTVYLPVHIGYNILRSEQFRAFVTTGFSGNYLLNAYYDANSPYDGTYQKHHWQGYSLLAGGGMDYKIRKKIVLAASLSYAIIHKVTPDKYLLSNNGEGLTLSHNYLSFMTGLKVPI